MPKEFPAVVLDQVLWNQKFHYFMGRPCVHLFWLYGRKITKFFCIFTEKKFFFTEISGSSVSSTFAVKVFHKLLLVLAIYIKKMFLDETE